ncbi:MAG: ModD protein [Thiovulaceae bacterium]|nr:ModD protein [Sulfurimonadaceae bacterium]
MTPLLDHELIEYIREDIPYFDLSTHLLAPTPKLAKLEIYTRGDIIVACSEEAQRIAELLGCSVVKNTPSRTFVKAGSIVLKLQGDSDKLHQAWKLCSILLEYACGIATYGHEMLQNAHKANPNCEILATRKTIPFAKKFAIRAVLCGGVLPHRLGLSESIVIFDQHRALFTDKEQFIQGFMELKRKAVEKKVVVESDTLEDAKEMLSLSADVIQMDKCDQSVLKELVEYKNQNFPHAKILAAGGINKENVALFAQTGVDAIVTSSPYQAKMADFGTRWINL